MIIYRWIPLKMRNISDNSCRENQNTHFMFNKWSGKSSCLWDNVEKYGTARQARDDSIMWRRRRSDLHAGWLRQLYRHTLIIFNTYCFSMARMVTRTRLNVTLYVHCLSCYISNGSCIIPQCIEFHLRKTYIKHTFNLSVQSIFVPQT
jgi:hypothetical protein